MPESLIEISENTFFTEHLWSTASVKQTDSELEEVRQDKVKVLTLVVNIYKFVFCKIFVRHSYVLILIAFSF